MRLGGPVLSVPFKPVFISDVSTNISKGVAELMSMRKWVRHKHRHKLKYKDHFFPSSYASAYV